MLYEESFSPCTGYKLCQLETFLSEAGLEYDRQIEFTVNLVDDQGNLAATGSLSRNVLKCIAVAEAHQGEGLSARLVTALSNQAFSLGRSHLFLFTKPGNETMFSDLGFYPIMKTDTVLLMENRKGGIQNFVKSLERPDLEEGETVGAIVANCNPFTEGHAYLIEKALESCTYVHLFILSEDLSYFSTEERIGLAGKGIEKFNSTRKRVYLHPSSDYLISAATFPTYFIKDKAKAKDANCALDIEIFLKYFCPELKITKRFVGTEPFDEVTRAYNEKMKVMLPLSGIELVEIPRLCRDGVPVSASEVRKLIQDGRLKFNG